MTREPHARPFVDLSRRPAVSAADWKALIGLLLFAVIFVGICGVGQ